MDNGIKDYVDFLPVVSDHEHHLPDEWFNEVLHQLTVGKVR